MNADKMRVPTNAIIWPFDFIASSFWFESQLVRSRIDQDANINTILLQAHQICASS